MARILSLPFLFLALDAFAQTPEPPMEKASAVTVVIFIVAFVAMCAGYLGYAWWSGKKKPGEDK